MSKGQAREYEGASNQSNVSFHRHDVDLQVLIEQSQGRKSRQKSSPELTASLCLDSQLVGMIQNLCEPAGAIGALLRAGQRRICMWARYISCTLDREVPDEMITHEEDSWATRDAGGSGQTLAIESTRVKKNKGGSSHEKSIHPDRRTRILPLDDRRMVPDTEYDAESDTDSAADNQCARQGG